MQQALLFIGLVIGACVLTDRIARRLPIPSLLAFICLGMVLGENGLFRISFGDFELTEQICCIALLLIMFYGGFNTNIERARPVALPAVLLSSAGVLITVAAVAAFAHFAFGASWLMSLLLGSVIASTDAASVFNVLREHRLSLKHGTDSLLELESGSNDPLSYILTVALCTLLTGGTVNIPLMLLQQIGLGVVVGLGLGAVIARALSHERFSLGQGEVIFLLAAAVVSFSLTNILGGSGFLAVYLTGMVLGASDIPAKREMAHFFDILTEIAQMAIFFLLGLLVTPAQLPQTVLPAVALVAFLTFIGRPLAVAPILALFGTSGRRVALTSWAGLRGAASAVFALHAVISGVEGGLDLFNLVFTAVLISLSTQGSLLPAVARRLDMVDDDQDVMRTFNDFQDDSALSFIKLKVGDGHPFVGRALQEVGTIENMLVVLVLRDGGHPVLPNGATVIQAGDLLVLAAPTFEDRGGVQIREHVLTSQHRWAHRCVRDLPDSHRFLIAMIKRGDQSIIPKGDTELLPGDTVVVATA